MSERTEALAKQLEVANNELIAAIQGCTDEQWQMPCAGEGWSVGVTAHHVANSQTGLTGLVKAMTSGQPVPPVTQEWLDERNAQWSREFVNRMPAEAIDLLRASSVEAANTVHGLSDEQLRYTATVAGNEMTAEQVIEFILIGHPKSHLASIRAATGL
jgi:hypothetical protein